MSTPGANIINAILGSFNYRLPSKILGTDSRLDYAYQLRFSPTQAELHAAVNCYTFMAVIISFNSSEPCVQISKYTEILGQI